MITVLTGTQTFPFDRLINSLSDDWKTLSTYEPIVIQRGHTECQNVPKWVHTVDFCSRRELEKYLNKSTYCITHGGTGSIITALTANCKVAVMPRLSTYGEHNDDHQTEIAEMFEEMGFVVYWRQGVHIRDILVCLEAFEPFEYISEFEALKASLVADIDMFLNQSEQ